MIQAKLEDHEAIFGIDYPICITVFKDSQPKDITAATLTILPPNSDPIIEGASTTITGNEIKYLLGASSMPYRAKNYSIIVRTEIDGRERQFTFLFHVLRQKWIPCITDDDLQNYHPFLKDELWQGEENYGQQIEETFGLLKNDIKNLGKDIYAHGLIDSYDLRELHILRTFALIFNDFAKEKDDIWWLRMEISKQEYSEKLNNIHFEVDTNEDGIPDTKRKGRSISMDR